MLSITVRESKKKAQEIREARILELMRKNATLRTIASITGMNETALRRRLPQIAAAHNLNYTPQRGSWMMGETVSPELSEMTKRLRVNLAQHLQAYAESFIPHLTPIELSLATGMVNRAVNRAVRRPFSHDWTLLQIAKLARVLRMTPEALLLDAANRPLDQPPQPKQGAYLHPQDIELNV